MNKRKQGELLTLIGTPAAIGWFGFMGVFSGGGGNPIHLLWSVPLCIASLPLLPALLKGQKITRECDKEDFIAATTNLPHIKLPKDYRWLDWSDDGITYIGPEYEEEFDNQTAARVWLLANGYQEVVATDFNSLDTYWVKQEI
jgi:hypothetical protein